MGTFHFPVEVFIIKMKCVFVLPFLASAAFAADATTTTPAPSPSCVMQFLDCSHEAEKFEDKLHCIRDLVKCVEKTCRIPECIDAHAKCREACQSLKDYMKCNINYMRCAYKHRHHRCKGIIF